MSEMQTKRVERAGRLMHVCQDVCEGPELHTYFFWAFLRLLLEHFE